MARINLLPWREMARKERKRQFITVGAGCAGLMLAILALMHFQMAGMITNQQGRISQLDGEIKRVDKEIEQIKNLEEEKQQIIERMQVIQALQKRRPLVVHFFDEIVKILPEGVYLTKIKQDGREVTLEGAAQSNARISTLMRNIEASSWLERPTIEVIQSSDKDQHRAALFTMHLLQTGIPDEKAEKEAREQAKKAKTKGKGKDNKDAKPSETNS